MRPTLDRLKREAASSGRSLEEVVKRYAAQVAATSSPEPTDFEGYDPAVTDPDVVIDGIPYAELVDLGTLARSEGISYEEAIDRFGAQSSNGRVIDQLRAEFPDDLSGVTYVDDQRAQDAVVSWLRSRPEVATMAARSDEETGRVEVTVQPKAMPDDAEAFKRGLRLPRPDNPHITVEVTLSAEPVAGRPR